MIEDVFFGVLLGLMFSIFCYLLISWYDSYEKITKRELKGELKKEIFDVLTPYFNDFGKRIKELEDDKSK